MRNKITALLVALFFLIGNLAHAATYSIISSDLSATSPAGSGQDVFSAIETFPGASIEKVMFADLQGTDSMYSFINLETVTDPSNPKVDGSDVSAFYRFGGDGNRTAKAGEWIDVNVLGSNIRVHAKAGANIGPAVSATIGAIMLLDGTIYTKEGFDPNNPPTGGGTPPGGGGTPPGGGGTPPPGGCGCTCPPPPDWNQVAQTFWDTWQANTPPIPEPPSVSSVISQPVQPSIPENPSTIINHTEPITTPQTPQETGVQPFDLNKDQPTIQVDMSESKPIQVSDPTSKLQHDSPDFFPKADGSLTSPFANPVTPHRDTPTHKDTQAVPPSTTPPTPSQQPPTSGYNPIPTGSGTTPIRQTGSGNPFPVPK